ncbi:MAG TPA: hypothetical protein VEB21_13400, partial [Terriglobales bacterium]|nr:hypothetical protein [Terriglobales bacterium]
VLPAHGPVYGDHKARVDQIVEHHEQRMRDVLNVVRRGPCHAYDVARAAFDFDSDAPLTVQFPATFETLAHLELLRYRGDVDHEERGGEVHYRVT